MAGSFPTSDIPKYYLGIEGDQIGPFTEKEVRAKREEGLPADALIWWDGQESWVPLNQCEIFKVEPAGESIDSEATRRLDSPDNLREVFEGTPEPEPRPAGRKTEVAAPKAEREIPDDTPPATFSSEPENMEPIFSKEQAQIDRPAIAYHRIAFIGGGTLTLGAILAGVFFFYATHGEPQKKLVPVATLAQKKALGRQTELSRALSELLIKPEISLATFEKLAKEDATDTVGKEAIQAYLDYQRQNKAFGAAGRFLLTLSRPADAVDMLSQEESPSEDLERALWAAYQGSKGDARANFLLKNIGYLLTAPNQMDRAMERLKLFQTEFPNRPHPYAYYLLPTDQRIQSAFNRLAYHFVQSLVTYVSAEFPQLTLEQRPLVEVKRNATGGYRIIGTYRGNVVLNRDRLPGIYFIFWQVGDQWNLIDTNITRERQLAATGAQTRLKESYLGATAMLQFLETQFRTKFPKTALHETVPQETKKARARGPEE